MRSRIAFGAMLLAASAALAQQPVPVNKQAINVGTPANPPMFSGAVRVGDLLFLSGQLGTKPGTPIDSTIQGQTKQVFENMKAILDAAGSSFENVAKCTVFLADIKDFQGMNSVFSQYFPRDKAPPARSTVQVAALARADAKVEIECIAAMPKK